MIESYKLFENLQKAKKILRELNIPEDNEKYQQLKQLLNKNIGYMGTFTKWLFKDNESFENIKDVYNKLTNIKIDRQIDTFDKLEDLYDYIQNYEIIKKTNQVIKSLPSRTRNLVGDKLKTLISLNIDHADKLKDFYSKKGGRYKTPESLLNDTKDFLKNLEGDFNLESILNKMKELDLKVIYEDDYNSKPELEEAIKEENPDVVVVHQSPEVLMAKVMSYDASCKLGTKHWCITTSKSMFDSYVNEFTVQYFIWDFTKDKSDKKHMIGATVGPNDEITNAHWSDDSSISNIDKVIEEL